MNTRNYGFKTAKPDIIFAAAEDAPLLELVRRSLPELPRGKAKSFLEHGQISVEGAVTTRYDHPVRRGQTVAICKYAIKAPSSGLEILYEDEALLAVNKPAGLLSVATDTEKEKTAFRLLKDQLGRRIYVVHRLDKDTSGVLLFAKSTEIRYNLQSQWENTPRREYLAICQGVFGEKKGRIETTLSETASRMVFSSRFGEGKLAVTEYEVLKENAAYSLLRVLLKTGRKNQIRVHMKELGHPVVGDKKYGASCDPLGRLGLHASVLEIIHPVAKKPLVIEAKADARFKLPRG
jgi:23S rRNA pseudouridine1911/1915/1917 synthase